MNAWLFSVIWPQAKYSAACERSFGILHSLMATGWKINAFSNQNLQNVKGDTIRSYMQVTSRQIDPNKIDASSKAMQRANSDPDVVIFDSFVAEEQYSHYIHRMFPNALKVVDLQDLHSLRNVREEYVAQHGREMLQSGLLVDREAMKPVLQLQGNDYFQREMAAIQRSDMVFTCSDYEHMLLKDTYNIPNTELLTFFYGLSQLNQQIPKNLPPSERKHICMIGNYSHRPNADAVDILIREIMPKVMKVDPAIELHIYGSNFNTQKYRDEKVPGNVKLKGHLNNISALGRYRFQVAPLRFGAGVKGKITDGWLYGLPVLTTPIGAEGLFSHTYDHGQSVNKYTGAKNKVSGLKRYYQYNGEEGDKDFSFGGSWENYTVEQFTENLLKMYESPERLSEYQQKGYEIIRERMLFQSNERVFNKALSHHQYAMFEGRRKNHMQALLWSETLRATEIKSKYINLKNDIIRPK